MEQQETRVWRNVPRPVMLLGVLGVGLQVVAFVLLLIDGSRSGWEPWLVFLLVGLPVNVVLMVLMLWSFHARYTEADERGLRHHEPVQRSRSFDLPWNRIADVRLRQGVGSVVIVATDEGTEHALQSVRPVDVPELQQMWRLHQGGAGATGAEPADGREPPPASSPAARP